jgi:WhiB family redox-sensing transcriptional regulator
MSIRYPVGAEDQPRCKAYDPELWFPERGGDSNSVRAVCRSCPVLLVCREYALSRSNLYGIWGGLTAQERRAIRKSRGEAA